MNDNLDQHYENIRPYHDPSWATVMKNFLPRLGGWLLLGALLFMIFKSIAGSQTFKNVAEIEIKD